MTTIQFIKPPFATAPGTSPGPLIIHVPKIQEMFDKEVANWPKEFFAPADLPITPDATTPIRQSMDFLNMRRTFTVNGIIDTTSVELGNAQAARDVLVNMIRSGGTCTLNYGVPSDVTGSGYSPTNANMYYAGNGFNVHITRIMISEEPKGGSEEYTGNASKQAPERYDVVITLLHAEDIVQ